MCCSFSVVIFWIRSNRPLFCHGNFSFSHFSVLGHNLDTTFLFYVFAHATRFEMVRMCSVRQGLDLLTQFEHFKWAFPLLFAVPDGVYQYWMRELKRKVSPTSLVFLATVQSGSLCQNYHFICIVGTSCIWFCLGSTRPFNKLVESQRRDQLPTLHKPLWKV